MVFLQKYTICFNDLYQKQRKKKSTHKETLVLHELCVDSMLSMGLTNTITVIMNTFTPAFKPHTALYICFLTLCLISARDKYDIT